MKYSNNHTYLWIHNAFLFKTTEINVHGVDLTPQIAVVLAIISSNQVAETGCHIGTCREQIFVITSKWPLLQIMNTRSKKKRSNTNHACLLHLKFNNLSIYSSSYERIKIFMHILYFSKYCTCLNVPCNATAANATDLA